MVKGYTGVGVAGRRCMTADETAGRSSLERWPARSPSSQWFLRRTTGAIAVLAAALAIAPIVSLVVIAIADTGDLWSHLVRNVLPVALLQTGMLLTGVAVATTVIGVGTAWAVSTFD